MTKREAAIVSAYTGVQIGSFSELRNYADELMGRKLSTLEMSLLSNTIRERAKDDFKKLSDSIT